MELVYAENDIQNVAKIILENSHSKFFAFYAPMGAGKTTLIKEICSKLNIEGDTNSPTFSIVNEYVSPDGESIYHFDFYRIRKIEEVFDIGFEEYLYSGSKIFMEWPELIDPILPSKYISVRINEEEDQSRTVKLEKISH